MVNDWHEFQPSAEGEPPMHVCHWGTVTCAVYQFEASWRWRNEPIWRWHVYIGTATGKTRERAGEASTRVMAMARAVVVAHGMTDELADDEGIDEDELLAWQSERRDEYANSHCDEEM